MADDGSVFPGFDRTCADPSELIDSLVRRRRALGLSQTEVAARMRTSQSALARLESGRSDVRMSTVGRYAKALDADVGYAVRSRATAPPPGRPTEGVPDVDE
jgi:transcriptional regulator with XRE-family HTH domain